MADEKPSPDFMSALATELHSWSPSDQGVQFGGDVSSFGRADALEDLQRLPHPGFGLSRAASGQGAPTQPGQRVRLVQRAADLAGQVQGLLVA